MEQYYSNQEEPIIEKETAEPEIKKPVGRFKRFVNSTLAAATLLGTLPSERASAAESQEVKDSSPSIENVERYAKENEWLKEFGNPELTIGQAEKMVRSPIAQIGIYKAGIYVDDLHSDGIGKFDKEEFIKKLTSLLDKNGIPHKEVTAKQELVIGEGVTEKVAELGMIMGYKTNEKGKKVLTLSANTQLVDKSKAVYYELDMEDDGRPDSYARLEVSNSGSLVLEGKDGESFNIEFVKNKSGEVVVIEK